MSWILDIVEREERPRTVSPVSRSGSASETAHHARKINGLPTGHFRGSNAAASLKHRQPRIYALHKPYFRGSNAAASLKHLFGCPLTIRPSYFRGSNAAASLKHWIGPEAGIIETNTSAAVMPRPH